MKKWFSNNTLYIIGGVVGAIAGYFYWRQIGCASGTCMITSKPLNSTIYGAAMGALLFGLFKKETKKTKKQPFTITFDEVIQSDNLVLVDFLPNSVDPAK